MPIGFRRQFPALRPPLFLAVHHNRERTPQTQNPAAGLPMHAHPFASLRQSGGFRWRRHRGGPRHRADPVHQNAAVFRRVTGHGRNARLRLAGLCERNAQLEHNQYDRDSHAE